jgi:hypothetical protein
MRACSAGNSSFQTVAKSARDRDLALGDLVVLSLRRSPSPRHDLRRGQQLLEVVLHRTIDLDGGTLVTAQLS